MAVSVQVTVRNRLLHADPVKSATVSINVPAAAGTGVSGATNHHGVVALTTTGVPDGTWVLGITPADTSADAVGPATASGSTTPDRIFRSLTVNVTTVKGKVTAVGAVSDAKAGAVARVNDTHLTVDLQPVWMKSPNNHHRSKPLSLIIVHHTGGPAIGPALNTFLSAHSTSANYVIDTDGQIVKMVQDERIADHAGKSQWAGVTGINAISVGIEIVNASGNYPDEQYDALIGLLKALISAHPAITRDRIVGHSDIATDGAGLLGRKSSDPGVRFEWSRLEAERLGILRKFGPWPQDLYGNFFGLVPGGTLRQGDSDATRRFGGANRKAVTGSPIAELQRDLAAIGYSVGTADGGFGHRTMRAVQMLQEHFFSQPRLGRHDGMVDWATATTIKSLR